MQQIRNSSQEVQNFELAHLGQAELSSYESSLKAYRDLKGVIDTAFDEGKLEGRLEGRLEGKLEGKLEGRMEEKFEIARQAKLMGLDPAAIAAITGLEISVIEGLV